MMKQSDSTAHICYNGSGVDTLTINGVTHYLTYEPIGFKDWILIGIVPASVVNESLNELQTVTITACVCFVALISFLSILYLIRKNYISIRLKDTEIKYREELFSVLSNNVDDIFLMLDKNSFAVSYVSPNIDHLLGISPDDAIRDIGLLESALEDGTNYAVRGKLAGMTKDERIECDSVCTHQKNGESKCFHITVLCRIIGGQEKYIIVLSDRTKERLINRTLKNAVDEAERANKAKSTFLSNMTHDICTPLSAIISFAMLAGREKGNTELTNDYLSKIMISGNYLLGLISDILDMSRIESGKLTFDISDVDISEILFDIRTVMYTLAIEKKHKLTISMSQVIHETVRCDRRRLEQLLNNLLSNAIKFTPDGGIITLDISEEASKTDNISIYEIRVSDNGIGMSEEFKNKIFEPFERERKVTSNIQGTGLGMPITKNIVDAAGGTIKVNTKKGKGTEFIVRLPFRITEKGVNEPLPELSAFIAITDSKIREETCTALKKLGIHTDIENSITKQRQCTRYDIIATIPDRIAEFKKGDTDALYIAVTDSPQRSKIPCSLSHSVQICTVPILTYELKKIISSHFNLEDSKVRSTVKSSVLSGKRILLAEDVDINCCIVKTMLSPYGAEIETAENGAVALDMIKSHDKGYYDCIIMDIQMPIMDGYECSRAIRQLDNGYAPDVPIIAMTANVFSEDRNKAAEYGINTFLTKPVSTKRLVETLTELLS